MPLTASSLRCGGEARSEAADVIVSDGRGGRGASDRAPRPIWLNRPDERFFLGWIRVATKGEPQCGADLVHPRGA